jgi:hypothetical protein
MKACLEVDDDDNQSAENAYIFYNLYQSFAAF